MEEQEERERQLEKVHPLNVLMRKIASLIFESKH